MLFSLCTYYVRTRCGQNDLFSLPISRNFDSQIVSVWDPRLTGRDKKSATSEWGMIHSVVFSSLFVLVCLGLCKQKRKNSNNNKLIVLCIVNQEKTTNFPFVREFSWPASPQGDQIRKPGYLLHCTEIKTSLLYYNHSSTIVPITTPLPHLVRSK